MYVVLLEWDGKKPPTTWYNRLRDLGLIVRGDKEMSPIDRRTPDEMRDGLEMVVFQEASIMCASESCAKTLAHLAMSMGAHVQFMNANLVTMNLTKRDADIMNRIDKTLGRRGRKPASMIPSPWSITCYEECKTMPHDEALYVLSCPSCNSLAYYAVKGDVPKFALPDGDIIEVWKRHRFARGVFEVPWVDPSSPQPPDPPKPVKPEELLTLSNLASNGLFDEIRKVDTKLGREIALRMLDAIFCARTYVPEVVRKEARMRACLQIMERSTSAVVNLREHPTEYDLLDASHISPEKVGLIWLAAKGVTRKALEVTL